MIWELVQRESDILWNLPVDGICQLTLREPGPARLPENLAASLSSSMKADDNDCNTTSILNSSLVLEIAYKKVFANVQFAHDREF